MRRIVVRHTGGPEVLEMEEVPTPAPGPGEALVLVAVAGVNFSELNMRSGSSKVALPWVPGHEGAGPVVAVGAGVTGVKAGDRVAFNHGVSSTYATHVVARADRLIALPAAVSYTDAAASLNQGTTAHYLTHDTFPLKPGDTCLVHGAAGGVGSMICRLARARGARVIGTASTEEKVELARAAGAEEVILHTKIDVVAEVRRLTGGAGVQVVYDSVGRDTFDVSLASLARRGMLVVYGESSGRVPPVDISRLRHAGSVYLTRPQGPDYQGDDEMHQRASAVLAGVVAGTLRAQIARTYPLAEAWRAHADIASRAFGGKFLLVPGG